MKKPSHFKALINYYPTEKGGLVSPVSNGFRTAFHFPFEEDELIFPGDSVTIDITLMNAESFLDKLYTGMDFELSDNTGLIGNGVVTAVYSQD